MSGNVVVEAIIDAKKLEEIIADKSSSETIRTYATEALQQAYKQIEKWKSYQ